MRRLGTGLLILVSALTLVLAGVSLWTRQNVIDNDRFLSNVYTMVDLPEVESRINTRVTDTVMSQEAVQDAVDEAVTALPDRLQQFRDTVETGIRNLVSAGVTRLLTNDPFRPLTDAALSSVHGQLVAGEAVEFTLGQAKERVPESVQGGVAGQVLDLLPDDIGVTLLDPDESPQVYSAIDLLKSVWWWLGLIALATLAGALAVSRRRRNTLRAWAVTSTVLVLVVLAALRLARALLLPEVKVENRDAVGAMYDVLAGSLRSSLLWLLVAVLVVFVLTLVWGRLGLVAGVRHGVASARSQLHDRRAAAAAGAVATGSGATAAGSAAAGEPVAEESWPRRVAVWWRGFADGLDLPERSARLGAQVRAHHGPVRWGGIAVAAVVLLFWPDPTLSVLVWIGALVALYLGAVEWLRDQAPEPTADAAGPGDAVAAVPAGVVPSPRPGTLPSDGGANGVPLVPAGGPGVLPTQTATLAPAALTPEAMTQLDERLKLLVRLGAARDAGVLTDDEFDREKSRLLSV